MSCPSGAPGPAAGSRLAATRRFPSCPPCSYFAIFGNLFGFKNFGKLVAADNVVNSLFGLLQVRSFCAFASECRTGPPACFPAHARLCCAWAQYPLASVGLHYGFTWINIAQAIVLLPLFVFAIFMYRCENADLVPIRPLEGDELKYGST